MGCSKCGSKVQTTKTVNPLKQNPHIQKVRTVKSQAETPKNGRG